MNCCLSNSDGAPVQPPAWRRAARRHRSLFGLACALAFGLVAAPGALAGPDPDNRSPTRAPVVEASRAEEDRMVCRRIRVTGSHMPQRVCHRKSEWRAMRERAREFLDQKERSTGDVEG